MPVLPPSELPLLVLGAVTAALTARQANILTVGVVVALGAAIVSNVPALSLFRETAHQLAMSTPLLTFVLATTGLFILTAALGFIRYARVLIAGGTVAFGLAVLASDAFLFLLQQGGVIDPGMYDPHGYSQRAGYVFYTGLAILITVGLISFSAHSMRDTSTDYDEDGDGNAGLSPDFAGRSRLDRKQR